MNDLVLHKCAILIQASQQQLRPGLKVGIGYHGQRYGVVCGWKRRVLADSQSKKRQSLNIHGRGISWHGSKYGQYC